MTRLIAISPAAGLVPLEIGDTRLEEADLGPLTSVAALKGRHGDVSAALQAALGVALPEAGQSVTTKAGARVIWFGQGHALVAGHPVEPIAGAALTDQSDGWCALTLSGPGARDVLARLTPIDLRSNAFAVDAAARTLLGHMQSSITRTARDSYLVLVFRSMAGTAVREISEAMEKRAARLALG